MANLNATPIPPPESSLPLPQAHNLLTSFTTFLTVCIHNILYYRSIYPQTTFLSAKAYNLPVHQNRHPRVCSWIRDAVDAVSAQLAGGNVDRIAVVIHSPPTRSAGPVAGAVLERWMFDVARFPSWPGGADAMRDFGGSNGGRRGQAEEGEDPSALAGGSGAGEAGAVAVGAAGDVPGPVNWADVDQQLRGAVRRLSSAAEKMEALPAGCTFTVAVELKEEGQAPIGVSLVVCERGEGGKKNGG